MVKPAEGNSLFHLIAIMAAIACVRRCYNAMINPPMINSLGKPCVVHFRKYCFVRL